MASVNKVILIGHLGKDPELRTFPDGGAVANVTIATTEKWKDKQTGETKEATEWHRVVFTGRLAEIVDEYLRKGSQVYVEGSLRTRKWTDQNGVEKYSTEIRADQMRMLGERRDDGQREERQQAPRQSAPQQTSRQAPAQRQAPARPAPAGSGFDDMDDDVPFVSSSMSFDMTTSKARKMKRYDY